MLNSGGISAGSMDKSDRRRFPRRQRAEGLFISLDIGREGFQKTAWHGPG
jgi:hypothetical protein